MADNTFFGRLRKLFSSEVVVRNIGGKRLKVADVDDRQQFAKRATNFMIDRYQGIHGSKSNIYGYDPAAAFQAQRIQLFTDYEQMDADPIISSAFDVYADESTIKDELGHILTITAADENIKEILHNLFYDVLNVQFNLWPWVRNMVKYGDVFLKLDIAEGYGITNVMPLSVYETQRQEGMDPTNPYYVNFKMEGPSGKEEFENYEVAHFRLLSDSNFLPYGKSMVEGARKTWKQLTLMEDAMLIHRIMRAPEKRIFKLDIGNIPPNEVDNYMQQVINKMKKTPYIDQKTGDYNLKYNMENISEDFFLPVRGGDSGTSIETLSGTTYEAVEDIEYLRNKMMAALKIPKAFLGYEEQVNAKATLAAEDVRFARTIERIQRIVVGELTKIAIVHLYSQGYKDGKLVDFELNLTNSSTIYEEEKIALWDAKQNLATAFIDNGLISSDWIYKNIFNFDDETAKTVRAGIVDDKKRKFRYEQIETEGNDPVKTNQSFGTPHDLASMSQEGGDDGGEEGGFGGGAPEEGFPGAGRPPEGIKYKQDSHPRGRDPLGAKDMKTYKKVGKPLSNEEIDALVGKIPVKKKNKKIIQETLSEKDLKKEQKDKNTYLDEENLLKDQV